MRILSVLLYQLGDPTQDERQPATVATCRLALLSSKLNKVQLLRLRRAMHEQIHVVVAHVIIMVIVEHVAHRLSSACRVAQTVS